MDPVLYTLLHDTSGPANRIIKLTDLLLDGKITKEESTKYLTWIKEQAVNINGAVDNYYNNITK